MTLRRKTLLIISVTIVGMIAMIVIASRIILLESFTDLEEDLARRNIERVVNAMNDNMDTFARTNSDYAYWDDSYQFVQDRNQDYIDTNLNIPTQVRLNLNAMFYVNNAGEIVFQGAYDTNGAMSLPIPTGIEEHLGSESPLRNLDYLTEDVKGLLVLPRGPVMAVSHNILTGFAEGPKMGNLIWLRYIDDRFIELMEESTRLSISIQEVNADLPEDFERAKTAITQNPADETYTNAIGEGRIAAYTLINDIYGNPGIIIRMDMARSIFNQGQTTLAYFVIALVLAGLAFAALTIALLQTTVLNPLAILGRNVREVGTSANSAARIPVVGKDELSSLAVEINEMLQELQQSQTKLRETEYQVRAVVTSAPIIVFSLDSQGIITLMEGQGLSYLQLKSGELVGRSAFDEDLVKRLPELARDTKRALNGETFTTSVEVSQVDVVFETRYTPVRDPNGQLTSIIGVANNVTERKRAEEAALAAKEAAEAASRAKSTFLANMSHELRTPLNAIIGYSELLQEVCEEEGYTDMVGDTKKIQSSGQYLLSLINSLLDLARSRPDGWKSLRMSSTCHI